MEQSPLEESVPSLDDQIEYCRFGKRDLAKTSWLAPLLNNRFGDALNLELRHEHMFFIRGQTILDDVGYSRDGTRFKEAEFGNPITTLEERRRLSDVQRVPPNEPASIWMGLFAVVLGVTAIEAPTYFAGHFSVLLGGVFVASGMSHALYAIRGRDVRAAVPILLIALIYVVGGMFMLLNTHAAVRVKSAIMIYHWPLSGERLLGKLAGASLIAGGRLFT